MNIKISVYDNGGETLDRYTVVINEEFYCMSENALGVNNYLGNILNGYQKGKHLGKKLKKIPEGIKQAIIGRIEL